MKQITVKQWMTNYDSFMNEDSFLIKYNEAPMPLCVMYGTIIQETPKMLKMELYDNKELTNNDNQWTGWILKSGILELTDLGGTDEPQNLPKQTVYIKVDKSVHMNPGYSIFLSFEYNYKIVKIIKEQPARFYNPKMLVWELPITALDTIKEKLKDFELEIFDKKNIIAKLNKPKKELSIDKYKFKMEPFNHQIEGIKFGLKCDRFVLGDEQGLGKTMQTISIATIKKQQQGYKHCLIICGVNGLKWNWKAEVEKHSNEKAYILGTRQKKGGKEYIGTVQHRIDDLVDILEEDYLADNYFLITNIETLRNEKIIEVLKKLCDKEIINMIVLDEGHKCKDPTSIQGKALLKLNTESMISLTGTPLMNNPLDLFIHMKWLGYENHSYYAFKNHYCEFGGYGGYQIMAYKNLDQLKTNFDKVMLRRLKKDVLDLPDKIYIDDYVEMDNKQRKIYEQATLETKRDLETNTVQVVNPLTKLIRMRQATDYTGILDEDIKVSCKLDRLEELMEEIVANNGKAIVFSNWTQMTTPTYERMLKYNPAIITGATKDRVAEQDKFMNDDSCKVIIGTIGAMGTGLTLTAATAVIFLDEPWNKALKDQAEDRAHRIGTKTDINVITLLCKDTIDEKIHNIVYQKGELANMMIDENMTPQNQQQLLYYLLD